MTRRTSQLLLTLFLIAATLFSCKPIKNIYYAKEIIDSTNVMVIPQVSIPIPTIQPYDLLRIDFYGKGLDMTQMLNNFGGLQTVEKITSSNSDALKPGYLVSPDGFIELPQLGKIKVLGLTLAQLKANLTERSAKIMVEPTVIVKFATFKVSMIGEVGAKGFVVSQNDKLSIIEAIGLSGDVSIIGLKNNVKVIRTTDTATTIGTIDLTSKNLFKSEYFYLKPNDVVYVPSNGSEQRQQKLNSTLPFINIGISMFSLLMTVLLFGRN